MGQAHTPEGVSYAHSLIFLPGRKVVSLGIKFLVCPPELLMETSIRQTSFCTVFKIKLLSKQPFLYYRVLVRVCHIQGG